MSEEKIQLPDFLIAELYKGSLVDLETFKLKVTPLPVEEEGRDVVISNKKIKFSGENGKGVIIIINQPEAKFLREEELTFLTNILKACQLSLADIAIINNAKQEITYEAIKEQLSISVILLFDVEPSAIKLPFMIPAFQIQNFDGNKIVVAPPLPLINQPTQEGKLLKTKLWLSLKKVFNLL